MKPTALSGGRVPVNGGHMFVPAVLMGDTGGTSRSFIHIRAFNLGNQDL